MAESQSDVGAARALGDAEGSNSEEGTTNAH